MGRPRSLLLVFALTAAVGACSGTPAATSSGAAPTAPPSTASAPPATPTQAAAAPTATPASTPTQGTAAPSGGLPTAAATQFAGDPCSLLSDADASAVNGVTYGAGTVNTVPGGLVECARQSASPPASLVVQVLIAPSVTDADKAYVLAQAALNGISTAPVPSLTAAVPSLADQAVIARASAGPYSTGGIYVQRGGTFFDVVYAGGTTPTDAALIQAATLVLGALP
jgi:hypothetical protein